jgi:hypothetical protein
MNDRRLFVTGSSAKCWAGDCDLVAGAVLKHGVDPCVSGVSRFHLIKGRGRMPTLAGSCGTVDALSGYLARVVSRRCSQRMTIRSADILRAMWMWSFCRFDERHRITNVAARRALIRQIFKLRLIVM